MSTEEKITFDIFKIVTKAIAESNNLEIMASHLSQLLVAALDIKGCSIFVLEPETEELYTLASFGLSFRYTGKGIVRANKSISDNLLGKPVHIPDISRDHTLQYPEEAKKEGIVGILSVPILFMNEVIGILRLYHHEIWEISERDIDKLCILGETIGLAMAYTRCWHAVKSIEEIVDNALPE
jgi:signal transduction protein with GAF and PtsI domain